MRFYRVVKSDNPSRDDFLSWAEKGQPIPPGTPASQLPNFHAVSVHDTLDGAEAKSHLIPALGAFIAALELPDAKHITWKQTGLDPAHYSIYGSTPDELLTFVVPPVTPVT